MYSKNFSKVSETLSQNHRFFTHNNGIHRGCFPKHLPDLSEKLIPRRLVNEYFWTFKNVPKEAHLTYT